MLNIKKFLAKILSSPRVIQSGTEGIWTWYKWSDGTAECWGRTANKSYAMTNGPSGKGYYTSDTFDLPTGLFVEAISAFGERLQGSNDTGLISINLRSLTTTQIMTWVQCTVSVTLNIAICFYVIGRWK